jgi:hypothetical protein
MATRVVQAETDHAVVPAGRREITTAEQPESNVLAELTVKEVVARHAKIQAVINDVLNEGVDYGIVPGTSRIVDGKETAKPTLFKSGAEKLATTFLFDAEFDNTLTYDGDHLTVTSYCTLYHIPTGRRVGSGSAICSTRESKYAYRFSSLKCPNCHKETLIHTKKDPVNWWCNSYRGGCSENFKADDGRITNQERGQVANDKLPDQYNTIIKMAEKRAKVGAIIGATGASEFVTQDLEDLADNGVIVDAGTTQTKPADDAGEKKSDTKKEKKTSTKAASDGDQPKAGLTDEQVAEFKKTCEELDFDPEEVLGSYQAHDKTIKEIKDLSQGMFAHFQKAAETRRQGNQ